MSHQPSNSNRPNKSAGDSSNSNGQNKSKQSKIPELILQQLRTNHWQKLSKIQLADTDNFTCHHALQYSIRVRRPKKKPLNFAVGIALDKEDSIDILHQKFVREKMYIEVWGYLAKSSDEYKSVQHMSQAQIAWNNDQFPQRHRNQLREIQNVLDHIIIKLNIGDKKYRPEIAVADTVIYKIKNDDYDSTNEQ